MSAAPPHRRTSILPNSDPSILRPMPHGFQVVWDDAADHHVLLREGEPLAAHHNGYSCHGLAKRLLYGGEVRALEQFDYIKDCGGKHYVTRGRISEIAAAIKQ